jgi:hypothetical protein
MTDAEKIERLRVLLQSLFAGMDELGLSLHPFVLDEYLQMAEILGIDPTTVPTERRALGLNK